MCVVFSHHVKRLISYEWRRSTMLVCNRVGRRVKHKLFIRQSTGGGILPALDPNLKIDEVLSEDEGGIEDVCACGEGVRQRWEGGLRGRI